MDRTSGTSFQSTGTGNDPLVDNANNFPYISLTPKRETGILNFLRKFPEFDGRGVTIAVLDTGVDPGAPGLQVTSEGKPKVIARFDCSGAGDVDTSTVVTPDEEGFILGGSGRKLQIPKGWDNPSGTYHVGVKPIYELYTPKVKERVEAKRKELNWEGGQRLAMSAATNGAYTLTTANKVNGNVNVQPPANPSASFTSIASAESISNSNNEPDPVDFDGEPETALELKGQASSLDEKLEKEEVDARIEVLDILEKKYKDWGPLLDCVVFQNSNSEWKVALALTSELSEVKLLGEYSLTQDHMELTPLDKMTVSVNVWNEGKCLEVVGMCGSHGTHVSSIAAAYFPENPAMNGVAPGAQVISLTIGDSRLGSMETGTALSRAAAYLMKSNVDVINMSYGEHAAWCSNGRVGDLMREVVDKYGITWVVSGGNHGPALSTVGTPPWICSNNLIGVGAYVSPEMMASEYSLRDKSVPMPYTWSSRGPTLDGDIGISICAPGGAITTVPNFTLRNSQLMNGTSMAAPHVAGLIALLQCAAKEKKIPYSPFSIKRALEASAVPVPGADYFSVGAGLVQVEPALEKLILYSKAPELNVRFEIKVGGANGSSGIYIRDPAQAQQKEYSVTVEPVFLNTTEIDPAKKLEFRLNLLLTSSAPWVLVPEFLDIANMQRNFVVKVQLEGLPVGAHHAKIEAFDSSDVSRGAIFTIHSTAIIPQDVDKSISFPPLNYDPGVLKRFFLLIPKGATQASLTMKNETSGNSARIVVHALTLIPGQSCKCEEFYKMSTIASPDEVIHTFRVHEGKVMEIVIGRYWADAKEPMTLNATLAFKSFVVNRQEISVSATDSFARVSIATVFQSEDITPNVSLKNQVCAVRPSAVKINSLSVERDALPNSRVIYELVATYGFNTTRSTQVQVNCSLVCDTLYEGEFESQLWMLFDSHKRFLAAGDAYPTKWTAKLEKGDYTLRLHVRHEKREMLERFMNGFPNFQGDSLVPTLPLVLSFKLNTPITLPVHQSTYDAMIQKKGNSWNATIKRGTSFNLTIGTHIPDKNMKQLPTSLQTHYFTGSLCLHPKEEKRSTPFRLFLPEPPAKLKVEKPTSGEKSNKDKDEVQLQEQMRDIKINWMGKLGGAESFKLFKELEEDWPNYLGIYTARLAYLESQKKDKEKEKEGSGSEFDEEMKALIDKVVSLADKAQLLGYFGSKNADPKVKGQMEKARNALVDSLVKRGVIFGEDVEGSWAQVCAFFDPGDSKVLELSVRQAIERKQFGRAAKYLLKSAAATPGGEESPEKEKKLAEIYELLGWGHAVWLTNENIKFKAAVKDYRPF